jgi:hypothetical protein
MKRQKVIYIPDDIFKDINEKSKYIGFNFSEWVVQKYKDEILSQEHIDKEISQLKEKIKYLKNLKRESKKRDDDYKISLNRSEIRFIKSVPRLLYEGYDIGAILRRFNHTFDRDTTLKTFNKWVGYYEKKDR